MIKLPDEQVGHPVYFPRVQERLVRLDHASDGAGGSRRRGAITGVTPPCRTRTPHLRSQAACLADWMRLEQTPGVGPRDAPRACSPHFGIPRRCLRAAMPRWPAVVGAATGARLLRRRAEPAWPALDARRSPGWPRPATICSPWTTRAIRRCCTNRRSAAAAVRHRARRTAGAARAGHRRQPQRQRPGQRQRARVRPGLAERRPDHRVRAGAGHRRRRPPRRAGRRGATVAVVGTGADRVYPRAQPRAGAAHRRGRLHASASIALGTPPLPANFPRRNRIISGLSRGVLVVEAAAESGSLITARHGRRAGPRCVRHSRLDPLAAVQGLPHADQARAPNWSNRPPTCCRNCACRPCRAWPAGAGRAPRQMPTTARRCWPRSATGRSTRDTLAAPHGGLAPGALAARPADAGTGGPAGTLARRIVPAD